MFVFDQIRRPLCLSPVFTAFFLVGCTTQPTAVTERSVKKPVMVKTIAVTQTEIQQTSNQPATVHAFYRAEIRAQVQGYVAEVKADIGQVVEAGDVLATIAVPELQKQQQVLATQLVGQKAKEAQAFAGVKLAEANVSASKAHLEQAAAEVSRSEAYLVAMESEFARTKDLVERRSLESRMLDEVRQKRDAAVAGKQAMESAIASAQSEVAVAEAKLAAAQADVGVAKAQTEVAERQLEEIQVQIDYATIKSPFSGLVTARSIEPGNLVRAASSVGNGKPLFVVSDVSKVRVHVPIPEADAALINNGDRVTLRFPSFPGEEIIETTVARRTGELDTSTRTMLVEIEIDNPDGRYLPGMFGNATIELKQKLALNMLPAQAVRFSKTGEAYVYVVSNDATVTVVDVTTGYDNGSLIEVTSGVEAGQIVVDAHRKRLADGQPIEVITN